MKTFRGPVEGFPEDDDDDFSDDDEIGGNPIMGQIIQMIGFEMNASDEEEVEANDDEEDIGEIQEFEVIEENSIEGIDNFVDDPDYSAQEDTEEEEEEGIEIENADSQSDLEEDDHRSIIEESPSDLDAEDEEELEEEHIHGVNCSAASPSIDFSPSSVAEVEIEGELSTSPVINLHRVYGELNIANRLRQESDNPVAGDLTDNTARNENGVASGNSSDELSELSDLDEHELEIPKVNGSLTPTPGHQTRAEEFPSPAVQESAEVTENEDDSPSVYSNPMISHEEVVNYDAKDEEKPGEGGGSDDKLLQLRGDCIGSTTYSERHVLKILIKWMKVMEDMIRQKESNNGDVQTLELETDFDNELSFLWDMSSEEDVAIYLHEKDIYSLLSGSLSLTDCDRLVEITIGILVNLLSVRPILVSFKSSGSTLQFLPRILSELILCRRIPRLIQSLAFLRRIVWYMSNVEFVEPWMNLLSDTAFIKAINFLLKSCRNIAVLSELVTIVFMILETIRDSYKSRKPKTNLNESQDVNQKDEDSSSSSSEDEDNELDQSQRNKLPIKIAKYSEIISFCKHGLIESLCESFQELLKFPVIDSGLWPNSKRENDESAAEDELQLIPPNAIQESICLGLSTFEYIHKIRACRHYLLREAPVMINIYIEFYRRFHLYTQHVSSDTAINHFGEGLKLVGYYQSKLRSIDSNAVISQPLAAALKFKNQEEKLKQEKEEENLEATSGPIGSSNFDPNQPDDNITSIALIVHSYIAQLGDKFGLDIIHKIILDEKNEKLARFLEFVNVAVQNLHKEYMDSKDKHGVSDEPADSEEFKENRSVANPETSQPLSLNTIS